MTENNFENINTENEITEVPETEEITEAAVTETEEINEESETSPETEITEKEPEKEETAEKLYEAGVAPENEKINVDPRVQSSVQNGNFGGFDYRFGYPDQIYKNKTQPNVNTAYQPQASVNYPQGQYEAQPQNMGGNNYQNQYNGYNAPQPSQYDPNLNNMGGYCAPQYQQNYYPVNYPYQQKNRLIAGLFGVLLGGIGLHNFYLGYTGRAIAQLLVTVFTLGIGSIWGFIEGLLIITGSYKDNLDANGVFTKEL